MPTSIILQDSSTQLWSLTVNDTGILSTTAVAIGTPVTLILDDPSDAASWQIGVAVGGLLTTTSIPFGAYPQNFTLTSTTTITIWNIGVTFTGSITTAPYVVTFPLSGLGDAVQYRLEEPVGPGIFWSLTGELYPFLVEAMNEAALITGEPEIRQTALFTLAANTTLFTVPPSFIALLRIQTPNWLQKTSLWDLDRMSPGWESDVGTAPDSWFPYGLTQFGIHPQLTTSVQVYLTGIALPVPSGRPYTGLENVPYQSEYFDGLEDYAAHVAALKEGGEEFKQSAKLYDRFLADMAELSNFSFRKGALRFTRTVGAPSTVTPVEKH